MNVIANLYRAIFLRFKLIMVYFEGENRSTHISGIMLYSIFQIGVVFLFMLMLRYLGGFHLTFPNTISGKLMAVVFSLIIVAVNSSFLKREFINKDSIFIKENKPTLVTDVFIVIVIFLMVVFSYLNDHL